MSMKIHYDGWLKLSPALLRSLGAKSGDMLEAELRDGGLVLRPVNPKAIVPEVAVPSPTEPMPNEGRSQQRRSSKMGEPAPPVIPSPGRRAGGRKPRGNSAG